MAIARNHQSFVEVLVSGPVHSIAYQQFSEVLVTGPTNATNYQSFSEVLFEKTNTAANVYQQFAEVLLQKDQATCFNYQSFVELLIQYDPQVIISDRAYATAGFDAFEDGQISVNDYGIVATFDVSGSIEPAPEDGDTVTISDLAYATSTFIAETPTLIAISDLAYATAAFTITSGLHITSTAIASNKAGTVLNGNPGILAENRDPW